MSIVQWNPLHEMNTVSKELDSFFDRTPFGFFSKTTSLRVDVFETDDSVIVNAEIPGVSKEDLHVYIDENSIRLSGQTKQDKQFKDKNAYRTERYYGSFSRTIPLPVEVKSEVASAEYTDGILSIRVPKVESTQMKGRKIEIQ